MTTSQRRSDDDIRQFEAPSSLAQNLQEVLVDLMTNGIYATAVPSVSTRWKSKRGCSNPRTARS